MPPIRPSSILAAGWALALALGPILGTPARAADGPAPTPGRPLLLAHVMPWYEVDPAGKQWGWHWTMNHFDPNKVGPGDRREVASHLYPAIGPYDSLDPKVIEYQVLAMKVAGFDGAILDWYGTDAVDDYPGIHRRTLALVEALKRHGLRFTICYEDRVVRRVAERDKLTPDQATARGEAHLRFCQDHWFGDPAYVALDGKPLLMVFGPDFLQPAQWEAIFARLAAKPAFLTLDEPKGPALGSFAWPPMWASKDGVLAPAALDAYLDRFERQAGPKVPCAFPGFRDIYAEAKVRPSYGFLDARDGATFRHTLDRALATRAPVVQVATWNDYGEGTVVEPTVEHGTRPLAMVQEARRRLDPRFPFAAGDLALPGEILKRRRVVNSYPPADERHRRAVDAIVRALDAGDPARARELLAPSPAPAPPARSSLRSP